MFEKPADFMGLGTLACQSHRGGGYRRVLITDISDFSNRCFFEPLSDGISRCEGLFDDERSAATSAPRGDDTLIAEV